MPGSREGREGRESREGREGGVARPVCGPGLLYYYGLHPYYGLGGLSQQDTRQTLRTSQSGIYSRIILNSRIYLWQSS